MPFLGVQSRGAHPHIGQIGYLDYFPGKRQNFPHWGVVRHLIICTMVCLEDIVCNYICLLRHASWAQEIRKKSNTQETCSSNNVSSSVLQLSLVCRDQIKSNLSLPPVACGCAYLSGIKRELGSKGNNCISKGGNQPVVVLCNVHIFHE